MKRQSIPSTYDVCKPRHAWATGNRWRMCSVSGTPLIQRSVIYIHIYSYDLWLWLWSIQVWYTYKTLTTSRVTSSWTPTRNQQSALLLSSNPQPVPSNAQHLLSTSLPGSCGPSARRLAHAQRGQEYRRASQHAEIGRIRSCTEIDQHLWTSRMSLLYHASLKGSSEDPENKTSQERSLPQRLLRSIDSPSGQGPERWLHSLHDIPNRCFVCH